MFSMTHLELSEVECIEYKYCQFFLNTTSSYNQIWFQATNSEMYIRCKFLLHSVRSILISISLYTCLPFKVKCHRHEKSVDLTNFTKIVNNYWQVIHWSLAKCSSVFCHVISFFSLRNFLQRNINSSTLCSSSHRHIWSSVNPSLWKYDFSFTCPVTIFANSINIGIFCLYLFLTDGKKDLVTAHFHVFVHWFPSAP
jgi:hypothetical protein